MQGVRQVLQRLRLVAPTPYFGHVGRVGADGEVTAVVAQEGGVEGIGVGREVALEGRLFHLRAGAGAGPGATSWRFWVRDMGASSHGIEFSLPLWQHRTARLVNAAVGQHSWE